MHIQIEYGFFHDLTTIYGLGGVGVCVWLNFILFTLVNSNVYYYVYNCRMSYTVGGGGELFFSWAFINLNSFYYLN